MLDRLAGVFPFVALVGGLATAQNVHVVDSAGGGNFFDLPAAISAALPNDVLLVRTGQYSPFALTKPLAILGDPGAAILQQQLGVRVQGIGAGQQVVLRGLTFSSLPNSLLVEGCDGTVVVENALAGGVLLADVAQVALHAVSISTLEVRDSNLTFVGGSTAGFRCERSRVTVTGTTCGGGINLLTPLPGLEVRSGRVVVMGEASTQIAAGFSYVGSGPAVLVHPGGEFVVDPAVTLLPMRNSPPIVGPSRTVPMVSLFASRSAAQVATRTHAPGASQAFLLVGLVRPDVLAFPLPFQDLWLQAPPALLDSGPLDAQGVRTAAFVAPTLPPGLALAFQAVALRSGVEVSNAVITTF
ncbi:MAG: hypothetical protein AB7I19_19085 [Planctomycetota bacterium]